MDFSDQGYKISYHKIILARTKVFLPMKTLKKPPSKVAHDWPIFFFSIANRPKTSPNLIFCSIKMSSQDPMPITLSMTIQSNCVTIFWALVFSISREECYSMWHIGIRKQSFVLFLAKRCRNVTPQYIPLFVLKISLLCRHNEVKNFHKKAIILFH